MADDIDFKKCAVFYDGHIGNPFYPSAWTNSIILSKNHVFDAEIAIYGKAVQIEEMLSTGM